MIPKTIKMVTRQVNMQVIMTLDISGFLLMFGKQIQNMKCVGKKTTKKILLKSVSGQGKSFFCFSLCSSTPSSASESPESWRLNLKEGFLDFFPPDSSSDL